MSWCSDEVLFDILIKLINLNKMYLNIKYIFVCDRTGIQHNTKQRWQRKIIFTDETFDTVCPSLRYQSLKCTLVSITCHN